MIDKTTGVIAKYICGWCQKEFEHRAKQSGVKANNPDQQAQQVSNSVKCPNCENLLKTWDDIKEVIRPLEMGE